MHSEPCIGCHGYGTYASGRLCEDCHGTGWERTAEDIEAGIDAETRDESLEVADTEPAPPPAAEQDDELQGDVLALEASLALVEDARAAGVPVREAMQLVRRAVRRAGGM